MLAGIFGRRQSRLVAEDRLRAYSEARQRQQDAHSAKSFVLYGRVARTVARRTGKQIGFDTAARMAAEDGFPRAMTLLIGADAHIKGQE